MLSKPTRMQPTKPTCTLPNESINKLMKYEVTLLNRASVRVRICNKRLITTIKTPNIFFN